MIKAKTLKEMLQKIPDEAVVWAYEGEDSGIVFEWLDGSAWIRAEGGIEEDEQDIDWIQEKEPLQL